MPMAMRALHSQKPETLRAKLVRLADAFGAAKGLSRGTVSDRVFGAGHVLGGMAAGTRDCSTGTYEKALQWFSDNWPDDVSWPAGIDRPAREAA